MAYYQIGLPGYEAVNQDQLRLAGGGSGGNTPYASLIEDYSSKVNTMPTTASGGYLSQIKPPNVAYPTMPTYQTGRERMLQQQYAAPQMGKLDRRLIMALTSARNKPLPAQSYLTREALSGFGEGMGGIMASALQPAQAAQRAEIEQESQGILGRYNADYQNAMLKYQQDYNTALMKEKERQGLLSSIQDFKLKQALMSSQKTQLTGGGTSMAQAQQGLLAQMERERGGSGATGTNPNWWAGNYAPPSGIYGTPLTTPTGTKTPDTKTAEQIWLERFGGGTSNMNTGGYTPPPPDTAAETRAARAAFMSQYGGG